MSKLNPTDPPRFSVNTTDVPHYIGLIAWLRERFRLAALLRHAPHTIAVELIHDGPIGA